MAATAWFDAAVLIGTATVAGVTTMAMAADNGRSQDLAALVASERAFAARAQVVNARLAFVEFLAPDAILFTPFAAPAFPRLRESADWAVNIQWRPAAAAISGAGDLGYTTGPAEYRRVPSEPPAGYGHYTSVWQRQADGRYRVLIDIGIEHPDAVAGIADWQTPDVAPAVRTALDPSRQQALARELREIDARLGREVERDGAAAWAKVLADDARLHLGGRLPVSGRAAALAALGPQPAVTGWTPEGAVVAVSGDFGAVYGRGQWRSAAREAPAELVYLNLWQRRDDVWRLFVQVAHPVRARPPSAAN
jgi:ketosteroid isomerase-like protein